MKKTFLISTAILISAASMAQTTVTASTKNTSHATVSNEGAGSGFSGSAGTSLATDVSGAGVKSNTAGGIRAVGKDNSTATAKSGGMIVRTEEKGQGSASVAAQTMSSRSKGNKLEENSSLPGDGRLSGAGNDRAGGQVAISEHEKLLATSNSDGRVEAIQATTMTNGEVQKIAKASVHAAAAVRPKVQVKPVTLGAAAHFGATGLVHIR